MPSPAPKPVYSDATYRFLDARINFTMHMMLFMSVSSGLWFFKLMNVISWAWTPWFSLVWGIGVVSHAVFVYRIADYEQS
ncbi:MAG: 2TM domain-containing protein [Cyanobacteria bacterium P01_F01_bin.42]